MSNDVNFIQSDAGTPVKDVGSSTLITITDPSQLDVSLDISKHVQKFFGVALRNSVGIAPGEKISVDKIHDLRFAVVHDRKRPRTVFSNLRKHRGRISGSHSYRTRSDKERVEKVFLGLIDEK